MILCYQAVKKLAGQRASGLGSECSTRGQSGVGLGPGTCGASAEVAGRAGAQAVAAVLPVQVREAAASV